MTQYELEAPWQPIETVPRNEHVNVMFSGGSFATWSYRNGEEANAAAWCPIVPPKVKQWRAESGDAFHTVDSEGNIVNYHERSYAWQDKLHAIGNYYQFREEAEAAADALINALNEVKP